MGKPITECFTRIKVTVLWREHGKRKINHDFNLTARFLLFDVNPRTTQQQSYSIKMPILQPTATPSPKAVLSLFTPPEVGLRLRLVHTKTAQMAAVCENQYLLRTVEAKANHSNKPYFTRLRRARYA